ncbi:hypothetical protein M989_02659 [Kluyvera georgiana ATCC 51603]|uniref:Phage protein n=1 Tax=Kluyvera georgiana ATCC 51603 TaxID=1354264 RepID=A0A1B7JW75_9ENTR|nr:hypothetical protein [Kluyvera georgiana]OAT52122.1 hypothetical protein M989_02659 [Kluyvera georgiana ATCC 51603]
MKKISAVIALFLMFSISAGASERVKGYGNSYWGMSPDEVISAESGKAHKITPPLEYYETQGAVGIDKVTIDSYEFKVVYQFKKNALTQVIVQSINNDFESVNKMAFLSVESLLTQKYGASKYKEPYKEVVWTHLGTNINLSHTIIDGVSNFVTVTYKPESEQIKKTENL